jgi:hypothetical protein
MELSISQLVEKVVSMAAWSKHRLAIAAADGEPHVVSPDRLKGDYYKVQLVETDMWMRCPALPSERIYGDWYYIDELGIPSMFWDDQSQRLVLI